MQHALRAPPGGRGAARVGACARADGAEPGFARRPPAIMAAVATKRQRRRREKLHRHEYELVELDESGAERPVKPAKEKDGRATPGKVVDHRGRVIPEPSLQRSLKRTAILAPILAVLIFATGSDISTGAKILNILVLLLIFLPMTYLMDRVLYNRVLRRQGQNKQRRSS